MFRFDRINRWPYRSSLLERVEKYLILFRDFLAIKSIGNTWQNRDGVILWSAFKE